MLDRKKFKFYYNLAIDFLNERITREDLKSLFKTESEYKEFESVFLKHLMSIREKLKPAFDYLSRRVDVRNIPTTLIDYAIQGIEESIRWLNDYTNKAIVRVYNEYEDEPQKAHRLILQCQEFHKLELEPMINERKRRIEEIRNNPRKYFEEQNKHWERMQSIAEQINAYNIKRELNEIDAANASNKGLSDWFIMQLLGIL